MLAIFDIILICLEGFVTSKRIPKKHTKDIIRI